MAEMHVSDQSVFFCWSFDDAAELFEVLSPLGRVD